MRQIGLQAATAHDLPLRGCQSLDQRAVAAYLAAFGNAFPSAADVGGAEGAIAHKGRVAPAVVVQRLDLANIRGRL